MIRYTPELLEEIKNRNDIVDVVSQYVILKRKGRNYFGLCPFHNEKSPSFSVSPEKQIFHCFGCNVGGDVFRFIMKIENISFMESVKVLADRAGVALPTEVLNPEEEKREKLKEDILKLNYDAAVFYHELLYKPESRAAQNYVKKRQLGNNTLKSFLIGYSGNNNELLKYLKSKGYDTKTMIESNLIGKSQDGRLYDKFRNRLMIPILDVRNKVIAFGGRVLDDSKPKYINSPESIVYSKGRNLFGLNVAKRNSNGMLKKLLIVEGYMDAISLYQRGITNVVASLGTALTDNQGRLLRRNCEQVILGYDADGAGQNAIMRGIGILQSMGVDIRVLQISGAKDPDEFVVKYGADKFKRCMDNAISVVEYQVKNLKKNLDLNNTSDKIKFLNEIANILSKVDNSMEREVYIDKISNSYQISKEAIYAEVNKRIFKNRPVISRKTLGNTNINTTNVDNNKIDESVLRREKMLIYLLINYTEQSYDRISKICDLKYIKDERNRIIIEMLYKEINEKHNCDNIIEQFDDEDIVNYLSGILAYDFEISDPNKAICDIEKAYLKEEKIDRRNFIINELENNNELDDSQKQTLEKELNDVMIELTKLK